MRKFKSELKYLYKLVHLGLKLKPKLYISLILLPLASALEISALSLIYPLLSGSMSSPSDMGNLNVFFSLVENIEKTKILIAFLAIILIRVLIGTYAQVIYLKSGKDLFGLISSRLFQVILTSLDYSTIQTAGIGTYSNLSGEESFRYSNIIINLFSLINSLFLFGVYSIAILLFSPLLLGALGLFGISTILLSLNTLKRIKANGIAQISQSRSTNNYFIDNLNNIKSIRCFSAEKYTTDKYRQALHQYTSILGETDSLHLLVRNVPLMALLALLILSLLYMQNLNMANTAYFMAAIAYTSRLLPVAGQCITLATQLLNDLRVSKDITSLYNYVPQAEDSKKCPLNEPITKISLKDVTFAYEKNQIVIDNFTYDFRAGNIYCLSGESGRGKSTILDLLLQFKRPTSGNILINAHDISRITTSSLRSKAIYLDQRYSIFNDTIENNLTLGQTFSSSQINEAVVASKLTTLIESKPNGLKTIIDYQGTNLSGGQKQRILLARALLRNPDVLILDETLSGLDQVTKEEVFNSIRNLFSNKIIIVVSHDKWVIENCDVLLEM